VSISNIVIAVDAELAVLERRIAKLREIRALALDLDGARLPAAAVRSRRARQPHKAAKGKQATKLIVEEVIDAARDLLGDGPTTVQKVHVALDRWPTDHSRAVVREAFGRLGARTVGKGRGGADVYAIGREEPERAADAPQPSCAEHDRHELEIRIAELADKRGEWTPEEFQYQLHRRFRLQAPIGAVREVLASLNGAPA
jgi:hypothetical protein